jgi:uracil-DNA glycosylase
MGRVNGCLKCNLPCKDVNRDFIYPRIDLDPDKITLMLISEAPSSVRSEYYYENPDSPFFRNTQAVFKDAGVSVSSYLDLTKMGIYLTTAIKCSKKDYLVAAGTIKECSRLLEMETDQFPNVKVVMCMGDFAIKSVNYIAKRKFGKAAISSGSTYKIRGLAHEAIRIRYFPSYTQTGDSFDIEKSKRKMITEDISRAVSIILKA